MEKHSCSPLSGNVSMRYEQATTVQMMILLSQVKSHQCCDGSRRPGGNDQTSTERSAAVGHGVLLPGRPQEGDASQYLSL